MTQFIIDCDGVLLDWVGGFRQFLWRRYRFYTDELGPTSPHIHRWLRVSQRRAMGLIEEFNSSTGFAGLHPCPAAIAAVPALQEIGAVRVLSSCGNTLNTRVMRAVNIERVFGIARERVTCLPLAQSKFDFVRGFAHQHGPRNVVMIEDCFAQAQGGVVAGVTSYCIRRSWNREHEELNSDSAVIWVNDLDEIVLALSAANQLNVD